LKLPREDIFFQVKAYIGTVKPMLIQQIRFHLFLAFGSSLMDEGYKQHWKKNRSYKGIDFLINSLEIHRNSALDFAVDIKNNKELYQDALYNLLELLNVSVKSPDKYNLQGLNLIFAFHKDLEKVISTVMAQKEFRYK
jgi:hypothetical protein